MIDYHEMELIVKSTEHIRYQSLYWRFYSITILFLSTFLLYYWWLVPGAEIKTPSVILIQSVPLIANFIPWLVWFSRQYRSYIHKSDDRIPSILKSPPTIETCEERYKITFKALEFERLTSTIISILVGFQILTIGIVSMLISFGIR